MYIIKEENKEELKSGRTFTYISKVTGLTDRYIKSVFSGEKCKKITAIIIILVKHTIDINSPEMQKYLDYYFETKEE